MARPVGGGKMQVRDDACHVAIDLLGEGLPLVAGTESRLHMPEADPAIVCQQGCDGDSGCVALRRIQSGWKSVKMGSRWVKMEALKSARD